MESEGVSLPLIHHHPMILWNDLRRGDCCRRFESISDGYFCKSCDFFIHKKCGDEASVSIQHPSHPAHALKLRSIQNHACNLCRRGNMDLFYRCGKCGFDIDLYCAKYPPPEVIENSETHPHKLTLVKEWMEFVCDAKCGNTSFEFPYKCHECDLTFHVDCVRHPSAELNYPKEVNHSYHSLHPLKLLKGQPPHYSDGKCRLCGREIDGKIFYHCSSCNFTLDMRCVLNTPPQSLLDLKAHNHQLTLLPRLDSFTCNACGLKGDRSPYACFQCGFMIHQDCLSLPRVININRHNHRVSRISVLGVVNSVCGVCRKKVDWTCGGYSCHRCPGYVIHSKCATRKDVWNGKELEEIPEEEEDVEPYVVIDDNTIQHFSHKEHYLRPHVKGILYEENKRCNACIYPIGLQSFYGCMDCDFILHKNCTEFPRKRWHVLHNERLTTLFNSERNCFVCDACGIKSNGFICHHGIKMLDVLCGSITEPFVHPSHPHHSLYYIPSGKQESCNGCKSEESHVLKCIVDDCGFALGFKCATLPQVVKHRVDDYPLSLCYGEKASGKYWCDICEKETNPNSWFYTCRDHHASLHTECVLGDAAGLMPRSVVKFWDNRSVEVVPNNSVTRPFCSECKSRCMYPINLKLLGTSEKYFCSYKCATFFAWRGSAR